MSKSKSEARREKRDDAIVAGGFTVREVREAEEELSDGATKHESSHAVTIAVLAHSWYALDHVRETSRTTFQRSIELRKDNPSLKLDGIVQQYLAAKKEIGLVEDQIKSLLGIVAEAQGREVANSLVEASHMNMQTNIGVRFPDAIRDRMAIEAGIKFPEEESDPDDSSGESQDNDEA